MTTSNSNAQFLSTSWPVVFVGCLATAPSQETGGKWFNCAICMCFMKYIEVYFTHSFPLVFHLKKCIKNVITALHWHFQK